MEATNLEWELLAADRSSSPSSSGCRRLSAAATRRRAVIVPVGCSRRPAVPAVAGAAIAVLAATHWTLTKLRPSLAAICLPACSACCFSCSCCSIDGGSAWRRHLGGGGSCLGQCMHRKLSSLDIEIHSLVQQQKTECTTLHSLVQWS